MKVYLIAGLLISLLFIIFALQNTDVVSTHFLLLSFSGSLAITLLLSFAFGVIVSLLLAAPMVFKRRRASPKTPEQVV